MGVMTGWRGSGAGAASAKQETAAIDATRAKDIDRTMFANVCWARILCYSNGYMSNRGIDLIAIFSTKY